MQRTLVPLLVLAPLGSVHAQTSRALIREADPLPAFPGHLVTTINEPAVNDAGGYAATVNSSDGTTTLSHAWGSATAGPGAILLTELTNTAGYDQTAWESFFGIDDLGQVGYSPTCNENPGTLTGLDCCWVGSTPIAIDGQPIATLPGKVFRFNSRVGMTANGTVYWVGGINDAGGTNEGEGLFFGPGQTCVIKTGDAAPAPLVGTISTADFDVRYSALGNHWIMNVDTSLPAAGDEWMLIDGAIATCAGGGLVGEGQAIPAAAGGLAGELWTATFGSLGINEAGDHCYEADTSGTTATDAVIVKNGVIRWREGSVLDGLTLTGAPLALSLNEDGDVAHNWSTTGSVEAIFVNDRLVAREGDVVDWDGDGVADAGFVMLDITGTITLGLSARSPGGDLSVYFTADVDTNGGGTLEALFRVDVAPEGFAYCFGDGSGTPCPCSNDSIPGAGEGCLNSLGSGGRLIASGTSSLSGDTVVLSGSGMPNSSALYFQGTSQLGAGAGVAFGDGLRCAGGSVIRLKTVTNVAGTSQYPQVGDLSVSVRGMVGVPGARTYQVWYRNADPAFCTASTFNLTNGYQLNWVP